MRFWVDSTICMNPCVFVFYLFACFLVPWPYGVSSIPITDKIGDPCCSALVAYNKKETNLIAPSATAVCLASATGAACGVSHGRNTHTCFLLYSIQFISNQFNSIQFNSIQFNYFNVCSQHCDFYTTILIIYTYTVA
jgi:hypothetical protein